VFTTQLEARVKNFLKSSKIASGMKEAAAESWVVSHAQEGVKRFTAIVQQPQYRRDQEAGLEAAFADLSALARS
jgi:hypothetical protein